MKRAVPLSLLGVIVTVACQPAPVPTPQPMPVMPTPTLVVPMPVPTSTPLPLSAPTVITTRGDKEWNYVALGDSTMWGWPSRFAEILERELGVKINIHNRAVSGQHSHDLLNLLRNDEQLRREVRAADVVTFQIPAGTFQQPGMTYLIGNPKDCGGADNEDCWRSALQEYEGDTDAIIAEIVSLRSPSKALIRVMDLYSFHFEGMKAAGALEVEDKYWRQANEHVREVATRYAIPVARVYDAFMGVNGDVDPIDQGYVSSDDVHPTSKGDELIARLFRELGYAYAPER